MIRYIIIAIFIVIILLSSFMPMMERFELKRQVKEGNDIQLGFLTNTPESIKNLMTDLNKIGGQLVADAEYDNVPTEYLDKDNIGKL